MAETFLGPVIQKLVDLLEDDVSLLKGVDNEVNSLKDELEIIQPFLKDFEAKLSKGKVSEATKVWLKQIRGVAERIEDVVEEYFYHLAEDRENEPGILSSIQKAAGFVKSMKPRHDIVSELRDINESLQKVKERGISYGWLRPFEQGSTSTATSGDATAIDPRLGSLFIDENELVGIDATSKELLRNLVEGPSIRSVISLVGEGGIGKTTLAKKVYNDEDVKRHFECYAWITVSQSYKMKKVLKDMKNQICPEKKEHVGSVEGVIDLLRQYLQTKRYVVVFDDVWQTEFWEVIKHALPTKNNGSRIIITTRNTSIAYTIKDNACDLVQELKTWSPKLAWELFCKKAFRSEFKGCCPQELEQLSREIVSKCQGLPLVIAAVAGLLSKKEKTKLEWQSVLDNLNDEFQKNSQLTSVSTILSFSYDDLPYHLKSCFLYFGIFPEDYSIDDQRLYKLWISEDFIIKPRTDKTLEKVAEEYLNELIRRNLVSVEIKFGFRKLCRVHDLIRAIILMKSEELYFCQIVNDNKLRFEGKSRRLSIYGSTKDFLNLVGDNSKIRSIFIFNIDELTESFVISLFEKFKLLKVLDFQDTPLDKLPNQIGKLYNLKYLNLRSTEVKMVPKSIGKLQNLQTLDLNDTLVQELPIEIKNLQNLRHLVANPKIRREKEYSSDLDTGVMIHQGIGNLGELQTLSSVTACPSKVDLVKELERLRKLKMLGIKQLTAEIGKALGASIEKMNLLELLFLQSVNKDVILDLKGILSPPPLMRFLKLYCQLQQFPDWISKLQNLQALHLCFSRLNKEPLKCIKDLPNLAFLCMKQAYDGEELHFEEDGFKKLKHLQLHNLEGLKVVKIDRGALPLLEKLDFGPFPLMKELTSDIQNLTKLKSLVIIDMAREFVVGLQPDEGPHYWKIQHVPSVTFWFRRRGELYKFYKLGSWDLLQRLKEQVS